MAMERRRRYCTSTLLGLLKLLKWHVQATTDISTEFHSHFMANVRAGSCGSHMCYRVCASLLYVMSRPGVLVRQIC